MTHKTAYDLQSLTVEFMIKCDYATTLRLKSLLLCH